MNRMIIPFNKPFLTGNEIKYIIDAIKTGKISGDGKYTKKCQNLFRSRYGFKNVLLTTSCTDALEMCAILINTKPGDEIILPSFTFVSTANAFVLRGAKLVFADSREDNPNIDEKKIEELITDRTKAIVVVHYAGISCNMHKIMSIAKKYSLFVIEDAAQCIDSYYKDRPLGSIGNLAAFSFHETKNIICGEGGMIVINDERWVKRAEIIREKGTNRSAFFRGEINKYGWVDIGSSFLLSDLNAAFLFAQLQCIKKIQIIRKTIWNRYYNNLKILQDVGKIYLPRIPIYSSNNAHIFYIICKDLKERTNLLSYFKQRGILAVFHYLSLHKSDFYKDKHDGRVLKHADYYSDTLIRLPLYNSLSEFEQRKIISTIIKFYDKI
jgi:dTDP-4-amino-4,6-dideoxygalactose transaminase